MCMFVCFFASCTLIYLNNKHFRCVVVEKQLYAIDGNNLSFERDPILVYGRKEDFSVNTIHNAQQSNTNYKSDKVLSLQSQDNGNQPFATVQGS